MAEIVAKRLVEHLEHAGFVVMKRSAIGGGAGADLSGDLEPSSPQSRFER
ncbi:MAG: hypothetical protein ACLQJR_07025 [Stellaceae bacterium]